MAACAAHPARLEPELVLPAAFADIVLYYNKNLTIREMCHKCEAADTRQPALLFTRARYKGTTRIGGLGLSGDTACADHSVAWRIRNLLNMKPTAGDDRLPFPTNPNNTNEHPHCPNDGNTQGAI